MSSLTLHIHHRLRILDTVVADTIPANSHILFYRRRRSTRRRAACNTLLKYNRYKRYFTYIYTNNNRPILRYLLSDDVWEPGRNDLQIIITIHTEWNDCTGCRRFYPRDHNRTGTRSNRSKIQSGNAAISRTTMVMMVLMVLFSKDLYLLPIIPDLERADFLFHTIPSR